ncbi:hypothetical protein KC365_g15 [Hortaea werneckii]|nr:hypothetical protein KC365_g15 [Hortaea werneckii]
MPHQGRVHHSRHLSRCIPGQSSGHLGNLKHSLHSTCVPAYFRNPSRQPTAGHVETMSSSPKHPMHLSFQSAMCISSPRSGITLHF